MDTEKIKSLNKTTIFFMWSSLVLAYFLNFFHSLNMAVLQPHLISHFQIDSITIANIGSMFFYCYLLMQIPTGILVDKFGVRIIATFGCLFTALGTYIFAFANSLTPLYIGKAFAGIGTSVIFICIIKFQLNWISQKAILTVTGIACFVGAMGGLLAQTPLVYLINTFGWRQSLCIIGTASLINAFLTAFIADKQSLATNKNNNELIKEILEIIKNKDMLAPFIYYLVFYGSYILIMGYTGLSWLENVHNFEQMQATTFISIGVIGAAIAGILIGYWADAINSRKKPILITGFVYVLSWAILVYCGDSLSTIQIGILLFAIGFFSCSYIVCWSCVQKINKAENSGLAVSIYNMGGFIGPILFPLLCAYIQENNNTLIFSETFKLAFKYIFYIIVIGYLGGFLIKDPKN